MKNYLIGGIFLIIISLGLLLYREVIDAPINIYNITGKGLKTEDARVYIDATFVAGTITGNNQKSFYVMFGDGVQYIVNIDNKKALKINEYLLDDPESSYRIEGITKLIETDLEDNGKKFVKEWLDHSHNHDSEKEEHTHEITTDDFYQYFGYVYLDVTASSNVIRLIIAITGITGILFTFIYLNSKYHWMCLDENK